jgi:hypothetical protein
MKISFTALFALLLAFPQAPVYAQAPPQGQPYIQVPIPDDREHCERLRDREHDLRDRLASARSGDERGRLEYRLREVRDERERCRDR